MADEGLNEVIGGVVGACGGAFVAPAESELQLPSLTGELRLVFEQTLIDRAELLDIEGGIVDAD